MRIEPEDYKFTSVSGVSRPYGTANDCYSIHYDGHLSECGTKGYFVIDTSGTGMVIKRQVCVCVCVCVCLDVFLYMVRQYYRCFFTLLLLLLLLLLLFFYLKNKYIYIFLIYEKNGDFDVVRGGEDAVMSFVLIIYLTLMCLFTARCAIINDS